MTDDKPPVARFKMSLELTANSMEELTMLLDNITTDVSYKALEGRTTMEIVSGSGYILKVEETNASMTKERYQKELMAWAERRRKARES